VNDVKISGVLVNDVDHRQRADGVCTASAKLCFNEKNGTVLLFAVDERVAQLEPFKAGGDYIRVFGRLVIHPANLKASILVSWTEGSLHQEARPQDGEHDLSAAIHRFNADAVVPGIRK
jgi:hypothetical protein